MAPSRPLRLRSHDVVVALQRVLTPHCTYPVLAEATGISLGESHNAVKRLEAARLVSPGTRAVQKRDLLDFLVHGVPYAFPGIAGASRVGVPTAHSAAAVGAAAAFHGTPERPPVVWPSPSGKTRGASLAPMCPRAPHFIESNPGLYRLLTLVDALRMGGTRGSRVVERVLRREIHDVRESVPEPMSQ